MALAPSTQVRRFESERAGDCSDGQFEFTDNEVGDNLSAVGSDFVISGSEAGERELIWDPISTEMAQISQKMKVDEPSIKMEDTYPPSEASGSEHWPGALTRVGVGAQTRQEGFDLGESLIKNKQESESPLRLKEEKSSPRPLVAHDRLLRTPQRNHRFFPSSDRSDRRPKVPRSQRGPKPQLDTEPVLGSEWDTSSSEEEEDSQFPPIRKGVDTPNTAMRARLKRYKKWVAEGRHPEDRARRGKVLS